MTPAPSPSERGGVGLPPIEAGEEACVGFTLGLNERCSIAFYSGRGAMIYTPFRSNRESVGLALSRR